MIARITRLARMHTTCMYTVVGASASVLVLDPI